jgi:alkylation response protein AidB-like acyl-CoA dehydrogenase
MNFALDEQQLLLQRTAREWFEAHGGPAAMRRALDGAALDDHAAELAAVGFLGALVDEAHGGSGLEVLDLAVIAEEAGRTLASAPLVSSAGWAVSLLRTAGGEAATSALRGVASATERLAVVEEPGAPVIGAVGATAFLSVSESGLTLAPRSEVELTEQPPMDPTRGLARVRLTGGEELGPPAAGEVERARHVAEVVLAAEDLGTSARCLDMAVDYAKQRVAFGRPIGSFQAIKHMCVDMFAQVEQLRSLVWYAAWSADHDPAQLPMAASAAKAYAAGAVELCASTCIQVHGGIGFTWEHDAHLYWRRAKVDRVLLGDAARHHARVAELALARASA